MTDLKSIRGLRGVIYINANDLPLDSSTKFANCICKRQYQHILCHVCGHLMFGRVRHQCSKHPLTTFLIDITNCAKCKANYYCLEEFSLSD